MECKSFVGTEETHTWQHREQLLQRLKRLRELERRRRRRLGRQVQQIRRERRVEIRVVPRPGGAAGVVVGQDPG